MKGNWEGSLLHCKAQLAVLYSSLTLFGLLIHTDNDILHWICLADILLIPYQRTGCSVLCFSISAADGGKSLGYSEVCSISSVFAFGPHSHYGCSLYHGAPQRALCPDFLGVVSC